jgi:hypothetical protein
VRAHNDNHHNPAGGRSDGSNPGGIAGGEVELLQQLGELPRAPSEPGLPVDRTLARWRWM